jgi:hypothetical protein
VSTSAHLCFDQKDIFGVDHLSKFVEVNFLVLWDTSVNPGFRSCPAIIRQRSEVVSEFALALFVFGVASASASASALALALALSSRADTGSLLNIVTYICQTDGLGLAVRVQVRVQRRVMCG